MITFSIVEMGPSEELAFPLMTGPAAAKLAPVSPLTIVAESKSWNIVNAGHNPIPIALLGRYQATELSLLYRFL